MVKRVKRVKRVWSGVGVEVKRASGVFFFPKGIGKGTGKKGSFFLVKRVRRDTPPYQGVKVRVRGTGKKCMVKE